MLPFVTQLMPPFPLDHLCFLNLIDRPQAPVTLVKKYALEYMTLVRNVRLPVFVAVIVHAELMLVVGAVETHFDLRRVFLVRMSIVHRSIPAWLVIGAVGFVFCELDLLFLLF